MIDDDRVTVAEKYAKATVSPRLMPPTTERRTDADVLIAAGLAAQGNEKMATALLIYRLGVTGDHGSLDTIVTACDGWLAGWLERKGRRQLPRTTRRAIVVNVLKWFEHPNCDYCSGACVLATEGTAGKLVSPCDACRGTGKKDLEREVPRAHSKAAMWLAEQIQQHVVLVHREMARLLAGKVNEL